MQVNVIIGSSPESSNPINSSVYRLPVSLLKNLRFEVIFDEPGQGLLSVDVERLTSKSASGLLPAQCGKRPLLCQPVSKFVEIVLGKKEHNK